MSRKKVNINEVYVSTSNVENRVVVSKSYIVMGDDRIISSSAAAYCHPEDKFDLDIGRKLATARSLARLSKKVEKEAEGLVKHKDDMRVQQERQRVRKMMRVSKPETSRGFTATVHSPSFIDGAIPDRI